MNIKGLWSSELVYKHHQWIKCLSLLQWNISRSVWWISHEFSSSPGDESHRLSPTCLSSSTSNSEVNFYDFHTTICLLSHFWSPELSLPCLHIIIQLQSLSSVCSHQNFPNQTNLSWINGRAPTFVINGAWTSESFSHCLVSASGCRDLWRGGLLIRHTTIHWWESRQTHRISMFVNYYIDLPFPHSHTHTLTAPPFKAFTQIPFVHLPLSWNLIKLNVRRWQP